MRFRGTVTPLYEGHRQPAKARSEYSFAVSVEQAGRFLRIRFPYPKYLVENVVPDPEKEATKPNAEFAQQLSMNIKKEQRKRSGIDTAIDAGTQAGKAALAPLPGGQILGAAVERSGAIAKERIAEHKPPPWQMSAFGPLGSFLVKTEAETKVESKPESKKDCPACPYSNFWSTDKKKCAEYFKSVGFATSCNPPKQLGLEGLLPQLPQDGPPLPRAWGIRWPGK